MNKVLDFILCTHHYHHHQKAANSRGYGRGGKEAGGTGSVWACLSYLDSLGIPDTSFRGLSTRTALSVRRSKSVPAVARILIGTKRREIRVSTLSLKTTYSSHHLCPFSQEQHTFMPLFPTVQPPATWGLGLPSKMRQELNPKAFTRMQSLL